jgi:phosphatidylserine/phosphatidylglycerophosphate/cardiolipin synthase-like enzyme
MPPKRRTPSKNTRSLTLAGFIVLALLFLVAGLDPFGMFGGTEQPPSSGGVTPQGGSTPAGGGGASGGWWNVYFADPATYNDPDHIEGSLEEKLITLINAAQSTIHIASFEFNLTPVAEALIAAHKRGVEVQWVTDDEHGIEADEEEDHGQFALLEEAGIEIRDDGRGALMHNKFWLFDNQIVWTGSTNVTMNDMFRNNNNVIVIQSSRLAEIYEREFQEMWTDGKFGPTSPSTRDDQSLTINGTPIQVLFASEDEAMDALIPIVEGAQESIYFMAFSYTHDGLGDAMLERAGAGLTVQGIFETRGSETEFSELIDLFCSGFPMKQDGNPGTFHHKVIVVDGHILITGSLNFSDNANNSNDENVIILDNAEIAQLYIEEFNRRWAEGEDPDPAELGCR